MKKHLKKVLLFALVLTMIVPMFVLSTAAAAPEGIAYGEDGYAKSGYKDIDAADSGYVQIGTKSQNNAKVADGFSPKLYYIKNGNAYYNATEKKLVLVTDASIDGGTGSTGTTGTNNNDTVGSTWHFKYWVKQNAAAITEVEFRYGYNAGIQYMGGLMDLLDHTVSVKYDSRIININYPPANSNSILIRMSSLKSAGHGDFDAEGNFTPTTYEEGWVNLTGFKGVSEERLAYSFAHSAATASFTHAKTHTLAPTGIFYHCKGLTTVVVPEGNAVASIGANVFYNCDALTDITILGTVDSAIVIDPTAFASTTQAITVTVNTDAEKDYFDAALETAGITTVKVAVAEIDEPDVPDEPDESIVPIDVPSAITADSFQVKMKGSNGLRALFSFDQSIADQLDGYTLVSYGAIAASYENFMTTYGGDEQALFEAARKDPDGAVKYIPVYNADGTGVNRYVDYETKTFCVALTNVPSANALSDIYTAGYVIWLDGEKNLGYTLTTYAMPDGEKAVNLYEITLGLTKSGLINSENTDDACFWQVLKNGALKTNSFNTENDANVVPAYSKTDDGYFTYCDIDWYAYTGNSQTSWWSGTKASGVAESASGLVWSVLKYSDDEYVLIYRNKDKSIYQDLLVPIHSNNMAATAVAPYDYRYGKGSEAGVITTYNPALSQTEYNKIKTVVIDHGVAGTNEGGFAMLNKVETIVYPSSFSVKNQAFYQNTVLKNIIWCHTDKNGSPVKHMSEFSGIDSLIDLRGFTTMGYNDAFNGAKAIVNVVFGNTKSAGTEATFSSAEKIERAWSAGQDMPEKGVLDLSAFKCTSIGKNTFKGIGSGVNTIKLPSTITNIKSSNTQALGSGLTVNFICNDAVKDLIVAYAKGDYASQVTNISVNGTPISNLIG